MILITASVRLASDPVFSFTSQSYNISVILRTSSSGTPITVYCNSKTMLWAALNYMTKGSSWIIKGESRISAWVNENNRARVNVSLTLDELREGFIMNPDGHIVRQGQHEHPLVFRDVDETPFTVKDKYELLKKIIQLPDSQLSFGSQTHLPGLREFLETLEKQVQAESPPNELSSLDE
ncbi:uncharacterized protein BYT42DRAFT_590883 [Radiomyces spectabilis]|uniref:uncharacterized protein n=1 Tax=Radiomyces spectabilis TaxID=64574 RepID=UPI002220D6BF|nr:uncharacterized protein BYT42DRAFT_590883 [Radiomyces spectabilis]KAI8364141.1 hypothetical protein BYT42DRAFT_590883 [Radiomyces spectabilis]